MSPTILADGIDLPIVMAIGLATFGPLTLGVSLIESIVFRLGLGNSIRSTYGRILWANVVSTLAGAIVYWFQEILLDAASVRTSIPSFVAGYRWAAMGLIALYWVKSVLVEGLVVARPAFATRLGHTRARLFRTVALANVASYLVVGPLFYYSTRPTFGNLDLRHDTTWTANRDVQVYFIDPKDHFVKRVSLDRHGQTTVVPHPAAHFQVSGDGPAFVYRGADKSLYVLRPGDPKPICAWSTTQPFFLQSVSLSPDKRRLAYAMGEEGQAWHESPAMLAIADLDSGTTNLVAGAFGKDMSCPIVAWSRDGTQLFVSAEDDHVAVRAGEPAWPIVATRPKSSVSNDELVEAYARYSKRCGYGGGEPYLSLNTDRKAEYEVECYPYLGAHLRVSRGDETVMAAANDYGWLNFGHPAPECPTFLPNGTEVLIGWWGQLYLLDVEQRRMGWLVDGGDYVLPTPRFRVGFEAEARARKKPVP